MLPSLHTEQRRRSTLAVRGNTAPIQGAFLMGKNEKTSKRAGSAAAKVLSNPHSSAAAKTAAGSALSQRPDHKGGGRKK